MGGAQRLQADVCQLELLLPQLVLQLEDDLGLGFGAFAQPATGITHREEEEGGHLEGYITHTQSGEKITHLKETRELKFRGKLESVVEMGTFGTANPSHSQYNFFS